MAAIKGVLREELKNSLRMKSLYERQLEKLPEGSLVSRKIKGNVYYYLVMRKDGKFCCVYKGRVVSEKEREKYAEAKRQRLEYRKSLSQVKKQIRFLKGTLRGKESI